MILLQALRQAATVAGVILATLGAAPAQTFPDKPITILVPVPPGGGVDVSTRRIADVVGRNIGHRIIVENRAGGGGVVAALATKQARPDGYTLFLAQQGTHATMQSMQDLPFDPIKDFQPVTQIFYFPHVLTVPARSPANTMAELVALAKSTPKHLSYGSQYVGSTAHLLGAMLEADIKTPLIHVPYQGGVAMNLDLVAGRLDMSFTTYNAMNEHQKAGKVKYIATPSETRPAFLSEVPTLKESGFPNIQAESWFGLVAPAGTPAAVVQKLNEEFAKAARDPELNALLNRQGISAKTTSPQEFGQLIAYDTERFGKIIKAIGTKAE